MKLFGASSSFLKANRLAGVPLGIRVQFGHTAYARATPIFGVGRSGNLLQGILCPCPPCGFKGGIV